jgi:hypothetical protein
MGLATEGGKKTDLMFVQHMVAILKGNGVAATFYAARRPVPRRRRA